jgi:RHS repeat-associated protein
VDGGTPTISYYHSDHLGSSSVITDQTGAQVAHFEYTPYGALALTEPSTPNPVPRYLFTGKELDATGLYFYGARYYDPEIGRFITADTIVQAPYDPQSLNRYAYCRNNPLNYVDPTGHWFWAICIAIFIGAATGAVVAAATGGNILQGALLGAISGAVFWGAGQVVAILARSMSIAQNSMAMIALKAGVHTLAGGVSGALGAAATGGNVGISAAISGISAGASAFVGGVLPIPGDGLKAAIGRGIQRTVVGAILGGGTSLVMGGTFGAGATQGARTSAVAYACNETMHSVVEKVKAALNTSEEKSELAPTDVNQNNNTSESSNNDSCEPASFELWDVSSKAFPGTNYCGATKSGPGQPTSSRDYCCYDHDSCIADTKTAWWNITNLDVLDCHAKLIRCMTNNSLNAN